MNLCEISIDPKHSCRFTEFGDHSSDMSDLFALSNEVEVIKPRGNYDRSIVEEVWESADIIPGNDSALWRKDEFGTTICRSEYGNRHSSFGWEISETNGGAYVGNLKALHVDNF